MDGRIALPRSGTCRASSGQRSQVVRPTTRGPTPNVNRISVVAGLSETMRDRTAGGGSGSPASSSAGLSSGAGVHAASTTAAMTVSQDLPVDPRDEKQNTDILPVMEE